MRSDQSDQIIMGKEDRVKVQNWRYALVSGAWFKYRM